MTATLPHNLNFTKVNEYRCTRQKMGGTHESRQGHYILAKNEDEARERMADLFPEDKGWGFDIQLWKEKGIPVS
jgi:hypothetical protein